MPLLTELHTYKQIISSSSNKDHEYINMRYDMYVTALLRCRYFQTQNSRSVLLILSVERKIQAPHSTRVQASKNSRRKISSNSNSSRARINLPVDKTRMTSCSDTEPKVRLRQARIYSSYGASIFNSCRYVGALSPRRNCSL